MKKSAPPRLTSPKSNHNHADAEEECSIAQHNVRGLDYAWLPARLRLDFRRRSGADRCVFFLRVTHPVLRLLAMCTEYPLVALLVAPATTGCTRHLRRTVLLVWYTLTNTRIGPIIYERDSIPGQAEPSLLEWTPARALALRGTPVLFITLASATPLQYADC